MIHTMRTVAVFVFVMMTALPSALAATYPANSLIIPMDTTYQNSGMFKAYGLVYQLLSQGIPVDWIIKPAKAYADTEFTVAFRDITTLATGTASYRGGPFVVNESSRAAALPIIQAWQTANPTVVVHEATTPFMADIGRSLVAAPRMAVVADGGETIAFSYLNAASVPDSTGAAWSATSTDLLTPAQIAGATTTSHRDGALFDANGTPQFSLVMSMHWAASTGTQDEAIAEIAEFLKSRNLLFAECQSAITLEAKGLFLTDLGLSVQAQASAVDHFFNDHPVAQVDGLFATTGGSVPSFLPVGSYLGTEGGAYEKLIRGHAPATFDVLVSGNAFQNSAAGRVIYLGGHQYTVSVPISTHPQSNGIRNFLDALLFAPATSDGDGMANVTATLSGPASPTNNAAMDFSITYQNTGLGVALGSQVVVDIPAGTTASMVSGGGIISSGQIVWNLGNLPEGQPAGELTFRLTAASPGTFTVSATTSYKRGITPTTTTSTAVIACRLSTATALNSSVNPSQPGEPVTFTATVTSATGAPTGTVTFKYRMTTLGTAILGASSPHQAIFTSTLSSGAHDITATYGGDANFDQSTSPVVSQRVFFTDEPLTIGSTPIKAVHLTELRDAVNAMRLSVGLSAIAFTDAIIASATTIRALHINQLRSALTEARTKLALSSIYSDDPVDGATAIKAIHIQEIRDGVK